MFRKFAIAIVTIAITGFTSAIVTLASDMATTTAAAPEVAWSRLLPQSIGARDRALVKCLEKARLVKVVKKDPKIPIVAQEAGWRHLPEHVIGARDRALVKCLEKARLVKVVKKDPKIPVIAPEPWWRYAPVSSMRIRDQVLVGCLERIGFARVGDNLSSAAREAAFAKTVILPSKTVVYPFGLGYALTVATTNICSARDRCSLYQYEIIDVQVNPGQILYANPCIARWKQNSGNN